MLNQAIAQGAYVVWFDTPLSNPKAYGVTTIGGLTKPAYSTALWLIHSMGGKGNLVINNGVLGTGGEERQNQGVMQAVHQFPNVHVVAQFSGQWATAPSANAYEQIMATHPVINGVWDSGGQGGGYRGLGKGAQPPNPNKPGIRSTSTSSSATSTSQRVCSARPPPTRRPWVPRP